jgi:hypothetical protein
MLGFKCHPYEEGESSCEVRVSFQVWPILATEPYHVADQAISRDGG